MISAPPKYSKKNISIHMYAHLGLGQPCISDRIIFACISNRRNVRENFYSPLKGKNQGKEHRLSNHNSVRTAGITHCLPKSQKHNTKAIKESDNEFIILMRNTYQFAAATDLYGARIKKINPSWNPQLHNINVLDYFIQNTHPRQWPPFGNSHAWYESSHY